MSDTRKETKTSAADEIEVTKEMIEAGVLKLYERDSRFNNDDDVVAMIFEAMWAKR